ncbi:MAG TPA: hypothetical protein VGG41_14400 [Solirubrobacteraceae bacterium]|jgi:hypothetical protein
MNTLIPELRAELREAAARASHSTSDRRPWWKRGNAAGRRHRRRNGILSGATVALAAAVTATVLLLTASTAAPPAYAVTQNPDGSYTIVLRQLTVGIPALNAKFRQLGIAETVIPIRTGCHSSDGSGPLVMRPNPTFEVSGAIRQTLSARYQQRHPALPGWHYVLAAKRLPNGKLVAFIGQLKDPIPSCLPYSNSNTPSNTAP